ncbi:MAG TPA: hypothetical protein IAB01_02010 [Candidatus Avidesulfovibrio excrementigallinarum]|nr:hypothetical protein [Candidatus Avidesulfovibrio excrementigallinarum]
MKTKQELAKRYGGLCVALCVCALGVALITNAHLGTSPITSLPYALTFMLPLSLGAFTFLSNIIFLIIQKMLLGRQFGIVQMMQLPAVLLFGIFIDFWMWVTAPLISEIYLWQLCLCVAGSAVLGLGISLEIVCNATVLPGEGMVIAIAYKTRKIFANIKVLFDISLVIIAAVLALAVLGEVVGLREGTVLSALLVGQFVKLTSGWARQLKPLFWIERHRRLIRAYRPAL